MRAPIRVWPLCLMDQELFTLKYEIGKRNSKNVFWKVHRGLKFRTFDRKLIIITALNISLTELIL